MKVLIVCSGNHSNFNFSIHQAFVYEQIETIKSNYNINYQPFFIKDKGIFGYLKSVIKIRQKIKEFNPDVIHAHFGLSGLVSVLSLQSPIIVTFHGSDGNVWFLKIISKIVSYFSVHSIFVSSEIKKLINNSDNKTSVIPCGVNLNRFYPVDKIEARKKLKLNKLDNIILFASSFSIPVKNYDLARKALKLSKNKYTVIELFNKSREEVLHLLNACDFLLMTSKSEGSPQIIKEALACNCPIVSTNVGDVKRLLKDIKGCYVTTFSPQKISQKVDEALIFSKKNGKTKSKNSILKFDNETISNSVYNVYKSVIKNEM